MAEAVEHSLQYLPATDLKAVAAYLQQTAPIRSAESKARHEYGQASIEELTLRGGKPEDDPGWHIFSGTCANCHQPNAQGNKAYPSLFSNTATSRADNLIATIVYGVHRTVDGAAVDMPGFGPDAFFTDRLSDQQIADVSNYVLQHYGNPDLKVTAADVVQTREGGPTAPLATLAKFTIPAIVLVIVLLGLSVRLLMRRRKGI